MSLSVISVAILSMLAVGTSSAAVAAPEAPVNLGSAGNFKTTIDGDVGTSPITGAALLLTCAEVNGIIYTVTDAGPLGECRVTDATRLTAAVGDIGVQRRGRPDVA